jgi:hypothetical protein
MALSGDYTAFQTQFRSKTTDLTVLAATDDTTLITAHTANHTIYIQKISVSITTYSAKTWLFKDSATTPVEIAFCSISAAAVALKSESGTMDWDFGPTGTPLTMGKNFLLDMSAAGAAGRVHVEAYEKLGTTVTVGPTN